MKRKPPIRRLSTRIIVVFCLSFLAITLTSCITNRNLTRRVPLETIELLPRDIAVDFIRSQFKELAPKQNGMLLRRKKYVRGSTGISKTVIAGYDFCRYDQMGICLIETTNLGGTWYNVHVKTDSFHWERFGCDGCGFEWAKKLTAALLSLGAEENCPKSD